MTHPEPIGPSNAELRLTVTRRNAVRTVAWAAPAIAVAGASPAFATSTVSLTPHIDPVGLQNLLNTTLPGLIDRLNSMNMGTFGPYTGDGLPQCAPVDFVDYDIYFTAEKNGVPAADGSTITFTLSPNLEFFPAHSGTVTTVGGNAAPPPFRIKEGSTGTGTVTALYEGKTESVHLPISSYDDLCSIPDFAWRAL